MPQYDEISIDKTLTSTGGVGSLINTRRHGSIQVLPFNRWPIYGILDGGVYELLSINDCRLVHYLSNRLNQDVKIFKIPENELKENRPEDANNQYISARYFPEWFYCPHCRRFNRLPRWREIWEDIDNFDGQYPRCAFCRKRAREMHWRRKNYYLEQIRFVLINPQNGEIKDVPWDELVNPNNPPQRFLKFTTSAQSDDLSGLNVRDTETAARYNLSTIMTRDFDGYKAVIRNASNIYLPERFSSLYIPVVVPNQTIVNNIIEHDEYGDPEERIIKSLLNNFKEIFNDNEDLVKDIIKRVREANYQIKTYIDQTDFRVEEYDYLTNNNNHGDNDLQFREIQRDDILNFISSIVSISKMKETSVLTGYRRGNINGGLHKCYDDNVVPKYYPAVENYGEGILFKFDVVEVDRLIKSYNNTRGNDDAEISRRTFVHTLSHAIMKRLEVNCGYSLSSLKERLYIPEENNERQDYLAVLIYCINGTEGSYGGITNYVVPNVTDLIRYAIYDGCMCNHDPICENNPAPHCYACLDIPEISCDGLFNSDLNRKILIHLRNGLD